MTSCPTCWRPSRGPGGGAAVAIAVVVMVVATQIRRRAVLSRRRCGVVVRLPVTGSCPTRLLVLIRCLPPPPPITTRTLCGRRTSTTRAETADILFTERQGQDRAPHAEARRTRRRARGPRRRDRRQAHGSGVTRRRRGPRAPRGAVAERHGMANAQPGQRGRGGRQSRRGRHAEHGPLVAGSVLGQLRESRARAAARS